ncbi:MAG: Tim44/TimA family putative adaptor protein [Wolbachia endosymbiont of Homalodisca vitripennis]|uniref:Tim44-like domain-containing protein n=2 Tax=unclassified Wolbachia TaxID=2640676 RepID=A0A3B0IW24_9RICK|nr:Tim44/TimA family putative adaptor protein [Wolbachia endosymbiont of Nilaparvata lugens]MBR9983533.1 Tim44 domain-containing protein [Wolbachia endosymbiont of Homalodisca vitripennis]MCJ7454845.1 Tim44/TimA family putative adaptor protein [Wolbachia endosymbiont of Homalodisca vitripennis]MCJ7475558.1 Tim44/TimA family putative adaptor protein [Wolbachia endosymbiont of Homalodisca vitripennis]
MIELVIYALLAAFIFSRLYNSLGRSASLNLKKLTGVLDVSQSKEDVVENIEDYIYSNDKSSIEATYEQILQKNREFSISNFIEGSNIAFELIIKYFNQGNLPQLKSLLDKDLYNSFIDKIKHRKEIHESIIVSIVSQKILEIKLVKNIVFIAVCFLSEQINFVKNNEGDVISGSMSTVNKVEDVWQFKKNINSSDPTWLLVSINYKKASIDENLTTNDK